MLEPSLVGRRGLEPQTHGTARAHISKEVGSDAAGHVAVCGSMPRSLS
jgi:hypothetical protein